MSAGQWADARFWAKVNKDAPNGCWEWTGALTGGYGYFGRMTPDGPHNFNSHRAAYESLRGPVPDGLVLDHLCRNRRCVNPDHLEPVTHKTNILRGVGFSATNAKRTHCAHGHPLTGDNLVVYAGKRVCRQCKARNIAKTYRKRIARLRAKGVMPPPQSKDTCKRGHPLTPDNLYWSRNHTHRSCRTCNLAASKAIAARRRELRSA